MRERKMIPAKVKEIGRMWVSGYYEVVHAGEIHDEPILTPLKIYTFEGIFEECKEISDRLNCYFKRPLVEFILETKHESSERS